MLRTSIGKLTLIDFWLIFVLSGLVQPCQDQEMPHPFEVAARSAVLIDATSGEILYGQNALERIAPASFVKLLTLYLIFVVAPVEKQMGIVQKIFYFHVPSAIVTFLSALVLLVGSAGYLVTRRRAFDNLARASAEIGLLFCSLVLVTGPIWAKPAWGIWWSWEARLTTTLLLWLLLIACLPGEQHEVGMLMFALAAVSHGYPVLVLGANLPLDQIPVVLQRRRCAAVVLSGSARPARGLFASELGALVREAGVPVFVGGAVAERHKDEIEAAHAIALGQSVQPALQRIAATLSSHNA